MRMSEDDRLRYPSAVPTGSIAHYTSSTRGISPIYDSRLAHERIPGGLDILHLQAESYVNYTWSRVPVLRVELYELPRTPAESGLRTVGLIERGEHPRAWPREDVWTLLGYLASVGPVPQSICAPKPFLFDKRLHIAWWGRVADHGELALVLMPQNTPFRELWRRVRRCKFLVQQ